MSDKKFEAARRANAEREKELLEAFIKLDDATLLRMFAQRMVACNAIAMLPARDCELWRAELHRRGVLK